MEPISPEQEDHKTSENEQFYDDEIAPKLREISALCHKKGFALVCSVEWTPGDTGRTECHPPWNQGGMPSAKQKLVHYAARCNGNIDAMLMAVLRDAERFGHSSVYLKLLGCNNVVDTGGAVAIATGPQGTVITAL